MSQGCAQCKAPGTSCPLTFRAQPISEELLSSQLESLLATVEEEEWERRLITAAGLSAGALLVGVDAKSVPYNH